MRTAPRQPDGHCALLLDSPMGTQFGMLWPSKLGPLADPILNVVKIPWRVAKTERLQLSQPVDTIVKIGGICVRHVLAEEEED